MQDIRNDGEEERLMDYYVMLHLGGSQRGTPGDVADPSQRGDDGALHLGEETLVRG
jgi:hypothetical protein